MKKNKKGFTLVELLAVIAILAILVIIALPAVLEIFNDSKDQAFMTQARSIYRTAEQQFLKDQMTPGSPLIYCRVSGAAVGSTTELDMSGNGAVSYVVKFNSSGEVIKFKVSEGTTVIEKTTSPITSSSISVDDVNVVDSTNTAVSATDCQ